MGITKQYQMDRDVANYCQEEYDVDDLGIGDWEDGIRPGDYCTMPVYENEIDMDPWSSDPRRRVCPHVRCADHCTDEDCPVHDGAGGFRDREDCGAAEGVK
jgi:hypothetical protein